MIIDYKQSMRLVSQGSDNFLFSLQRGKKEIVMLWIIQTIIDWQQSMRLVSQGSDIVFPLYWGGKQNLWCSESYKWLLINNSL